jgi:hypothetical protein
MQSCAHLLSQYTLLRPSLRSAAAAARRAQQHLYRPQSSSMSSSAAAPPSSAAAEADRAPMPRPEDEDSRRPAPTEPLLSIAPM